MIPKKGFEMHKVDFSCIITLTQSTQVLIDGSIISMLCNDSMTNVP